MCFRFPNLATIGTQKKVELRCPTFRPTTVKYGRTIQTNPHYCMELNMGLKAGLIFTYRFHFFIYRTPYFICSGDTPALNGFEPSRVLTAAVLHGSLPASYDCV